MRPPSRTRKHPAPVRWKPLVVEEQWAPIHIEGIEHHEASTHGRVRDAKRRVMKLATRDDGYQVVMLRSATKKKQVYVYVHRAVAAAWLDDFGEPGMTVHHINRQRADNRLGNLRMATRTQQQLDRDHTKCKGAPVPIVQSFVDGTILCTHDSVTAAAQSVGKTGNSAQIRILECLKGERAEAYGYSWALPPHADLDGEQWKFFTDTTMVSDKGRVRQRMKCGLWAPARAAGDLCSTSTGYPTFATKSKQHLLHRVVAELFVTKSEGQTQVNHIDGDKTNAAAHNLEWVTRSQNIKHAHQTGLIKPATKAVAQHSPGGRVIKVYSSAQRAQDATGIKRHNISKAVRGTTKMAGGYSWSYAM